MPGSIAFTTIDQGRRIEVRRDEHVPDEAWRKVRSEWGQLGSHPNAAILVPIELFSSRHAWLPATARRYGLEVTLDPSSREVLERRQSDRSQLELALGSQDGTSLQENRTFPPSDRFSRDLRKFQIRDVAKLLSLSHGANFSVPGSGKTTVELAVYESERLLERVEQLLVVAPLSAFEAWAEDSAACLKPSPVIHRFDGSEIPDEVELLLVNYQRLEGGFEALSAWLRKRPSLLVLDEAHRMKRGRDGQWGSACLDLAFLAERRDVLTGTPAPQHPSDLVAILDFLWPGQGEQILPHRALVPQPTAEAVEEVTASIGPLFVRTTKNELNLRKPKKTVITIPLGKLHSEIYSALRDKFALLAASQKERVDLRRWGSITMYLLEAATNPSLLPAGSSSDDPIRFQHPPLEIPQSASISQLVADYASFETPEKFVQLAGLVRNLRADGRKILVWSTFVRNLTTLERILAGENPAIVHGGIPSQLTQPTAPRHRESELERFRSDPECGVLLANPAAIGEGISLHHVCHDAVYLERTFNAGQYLQSVDRIHRIGLSSSQETNVYFLVSEGTIDEVVAQRIDWKAENLGRMLDDPSIVTMALPDEDDVGQPIDVGDEADIEALFAHLRGGGAIS